MALFLKSVVDTTVAKFQNNNAFWLNYFALKLKIENKHVHIKFVNFCVTKTFKEQVRI